MSRRLVNLTLDTLEDLPPRCRRCVFWELDPVAAERAHAAGGTGLEKEAWVSRALLEWGSCGKLVYVDGAPAGFAVFAPPSLVPRSVAFPTSPISADAVLLMTAHIVPAFAGGGLGRMLIQGVARDVTKRGFRAIEAFGSASGVLRKSEPQPGPGPRSEQRPAERPTGSEAESEVAHGCLVPADFFLAVGFKTVRPHPRYPRVRLDLRTALSWKSDVEYALERLLGSMSPDAILRPAAHA